MSSTIDPKKQKSRLGRGLSSLMGIGAAPSDVPVDPVYVEVPGQPAPPAPGVQAVIAHGKPADIAIDTVRPNPHQPRREFDDVSLNELAASIKTNGIIQPIVVKALGDGQGYELIAGERRLRAAKLVGLTTIPAIIREADRYSQAQMALVENIQRSDLNPIDRAAGYKVLMTELGLTATELATRLGEDRSTVANHLRVLDLTAKVQELVRNGKLSFGHAKVLGGIPDPAEQLRLAELCVSQELSVRNLERILTTATEPPAAKSDKPLPSAHLKQVELNMTKQIGLRVQVRAGAKKGRGKVVIHYNSLDEFDTLVGRLGVSLDE
jgi:ParB family transcriptional regulator, chromosome partitioning protein